MELIRVMVVDDAADARMLIRLVLEEEPDFEVVAAVGSAEAALATVPEAQPDVVLLDARMPIVDGFELARSLRATSTDLRIAILSSMVDEVTRREASAAGADACVSKGDINSLPEIVRGLTRRLAS